MDISKYGEIHGRIKSLFSLALPILVVQIFQILWIVGLGMDITKIGLKLLIIQVIFYLVNLLWVLPDLFNDSKFIRFFFKQVSFLLGYLLIRALIVYDQPISKRFLEFLLLKEQLLYFLLHIFLVLASSYFAAFFRQSQINFYKKEAALSANLESLKTMRRLETSMYQMQLSSHFTFNVLNTIKLSTAEELPNVSLATEQLASILKGFLVDPIKVHTEDLRNTINAISSYIELERFMKGTKFYVNYYMNIPENNYKFPPGILLTLVENVFKYGVVHEEEYAALIELQLQGNHLSLHTRNLKRISIMKGNGLGQNNVKSILDHYYPHYTFLINESEDYYDLKMEVKL